MSRLCTSFRVLCIVALLVSANVAMSAPIEAKNSNNAKAAKQAKAKSSKPIFRVNGCPRHCWTP